ncbi:MAG: protein kinase [Polyangiaceae bacterium]|nr:protein kinase [Polyangiaceae bacterium]
MVDALEESSRLPGIGDIVANKFVIERLIGRGGMGSVFAARHIELESVVAVKVMLFDTMNVEAIARFKNEGRAAARIRSEHVVRVEDVGEEKGYAYMILELLEGEDLAHVLERRRPLPTSEVITYMLEALEGVKLAHDKGIIHRDLKPSNLFLAKNDNGTSIVKVLDFGISKSSSLAAVPSALTTTKAMLGSPMYMSPEQLRSPKRVDERADIWALGVIMYELLTGTLPFMGETLGELFSAILELDPVPVRVCRPDVPAELETIVMRCLQANPDHRFQTVSEIIAALTPLSVESTSRANGNNANGLLSLAVTQQLPGSGKKALGPMPAVVFGAQSSQERTVGINPTDPPNVSTSNVPVVVATLAIGGPNTPPPHLTQSGLSVLDQTRRQRIWSKPKSRTVFGMVAGVLAIMGLVLGAVALGNDPPKPPSHGTTTKPTGSSLVPQAPASQTPISHEPVVPTATPSFRDASIEPVVVYSTTTPSDHPSTTPSGITATDLAPPSNPQPPTAVKPPGGTTKPPGGTTKPPGPKPPGPKSPGPKPLGPTAPPQPTTTASSPGYSSWR